MQFTFVQLGAFITRWKEYDLTDDDLQALETELARQPEVGAVMVGTGGLRKMRFAPPSRHTGKRGGFRVGYVYYRAASTIYLFVLFSKTEQANLTSAEKAAVRGAIAAIGAGPT